MNGMGADFKAAKMAGGFIKWTGEGNPGPAVIVSSKRLVKPGQMANYIAANGRFADFMKQTQPGVLAFYVAQHPTEPDAVCDLQIFADMKTFSEHADMTNPDIKPKIEDWFQYVDFSGARGPALTG